MEAALDAGEISIHKGYEIVKKAMHLPGVNSLQEGSCKRPVRQLFHTGVFLS